MKAAGRKLDLEGARTELQGVASSAYMEAFNKMTAPLEGTTPMLETYDEYSAMGRGEGLGLEYSPDVGPAMRTFLDYNRRLTGAAPGGLRHGE